MVPALLKRMLNEMRFRSFLRPPSEAQSFGASFGGTSDRTRWLMSGLAKQLSAPYPWLNVSESARQPWENPEIPSGYTYLTQLVAHDCVFTSIPTGALGAPAARTSRRSSLLRLETIYGEGPDSSPQAYFPSGTNHLARSRLAVGGPSVRDSAKGSYLFRDVDRAAISLAAKTETRQSSAQIADARNDIHAAMAQITTLFILLHNKIALLVEKLLDEEDFASEEIKGYRIYFISRMFCEHIYRTIVRCDLLPRLLHPAVAAAYDDPAVDFVDTQGFDALPIEFASVLRFGHAMVRPSYVFNDFNSYGEDLIDMMLTTSAARPWRMPLDETWIAQWSHFFEIGGSEPNLSRRIGPEFSGGLFSGEVFSAIDKTRSVGLGYRDLLSGAFVGMWSVSSLACEIRRRRPQFAGLSRLLLYDAFRIDRLRTWLSTCRVSNGLSDQDLNDLASDPPLVFYTLFEAAHDMEGRRLGALGSLILAETFYGAIREFQTERIGAIASACEIALGRAGKAASIERCVPIIRSMPDLVSFVTDGLEETRLATPLI
jgi:hypothetical protein